MSKIMVVGMAPFPVPFPNGRHLAPGEIAEVEHDSYIKGCLNAGKLAVVTRPAPTKKQIEPPSLSGDDSD